MQENPHWDQATVKKLVKYQVEPGMTKEMVTAALGTPTHKSMEEEEELWEYYSYSYHPLAGFRIDIYLYIYFLNGAVTRTSYWEHV
jgi:outer membrane protein assembly factor BamE (lipoprotein component of BamABCDE complex)